MTWHMKEQEQETHPQRSNDNGNGRSHHLLNASYVPGHLPCAFTRIMWTLMAALLSWHKYFISLGISGKERIWTYIFDPFIVRRTGTPPPNLKGTTTTTKRAVLTRYKKLWEVTTALTCLTRSSAATMAKVSYCTATVRACHCHHLHWRTISLLVAASIIAILVCGHHWVHLSLWPPLSLVSKERLFLFSALSSRRSGFHCQYLRWNSTGKGLAEI